MELTRDAHSPLGFPWAGHETSPPINGAEKRWAKVPFRVPRHLGPSTLRVQTLICLVIFDDQKHLLDLKYLPAFFAYRHSPSPRPAVRS